MQAFQFNTTPQVIFRPGAAKEIGALARLKCGARPLFVTDPGLRRIGLCDPALQSLAQAGLAVTVFDAVEADPSLATVMAAVEAGRAAEVTGVIGFGGGSSLDVAKVVALLLGSGEEIDKAWGVGNAKGPRLPLILVPTTAGTGSEVTPVSIITVGGEEKRGVSSPILLPDVALLDPDLTLGLPAPITAATGIDAMVHAIEAYTSALKKNPMSDLLAREALRLLAANLDEAVHNGSNREARQAMLLGACLAGQAFANAPVAAVHALAYPLGGNFHIPHGLSNALVLPQVLRFNVSAATTHYGELAPIILGDRLRTDDPSTYAEQLIEEFEQMSARVGLPTRLRDAGVPEEMLPQLAKEAMLQQRLLVNNPREVTEADALAIYQAAY